MRIYKDTTDYRYVQKEYLYTEDLYGKYTTIRMIKVVSNKDKNDESFMSGDLYFFIKTKYFFTLNRYLIFY